MSSVTLESTEASFQQWREQRSSRNESIPGYLWQMALSLYPHHNRAKICRRLALSGGQFKQRIASVSPKCADTGFVLASSEGVKTGPQPKTEVQLAIQGKERSLTLSVGVDVLLQLLPHIATLL